MRADSMAEIEQALRASDDEQPQTRVSDANMTPDLPHEDLPQQEEVSREPRTIAWKNMIANIPQPTSLLVPLVMLLVAFFLLIPVNGHTRFVWLWLTLTGNASIGQGSGGGESPLVPDLAQTAFIPPMPFSHVQEIL
jgi:hypothetical protein